MLWDSDIFTLNKETIGQKCHKFTVFRRYRWAIKPDILQKLNAQLTLLLEFEAVVISVFKNSSYLIYSDIRGCGLMCPTLSEKDKASYDELTNSKTDIVRFRSRSGLYSLV